MGAAVVITRLDLTASGLRAAARRAKDGPAARRMLCLAMVFDFGPQDGGRGLRHGSPDSAVPCWPPRDQRYEWAYIFGAVCPQRRATAALVLPAANTEAMSLHLAEIGRQVAPGAHAALVLDGAGYHLATDLAVSENITLVSLPPYAPELNPVENVWEYLRGNKLAITVFDSYDDILDKACTAWTFFADDPDRIASITTRSWATVSC